MNKALKKKWIKALRSGEYVQGTRSLVRFGEKYDYFCCLGVLLDVMGCEFTKTESGEAQAWLDGEEIDDLGYGLLEGPGGAVGSTKMWNLIALNRWSENDCHG